MPNNTNPPSAVWMTSVTKSGGVVGLWRRNGRSNPLIHCGLQEPSLSELLVDPQTSTLAVWRYVLCFFAFAYLDFSAYTDIAVLTMEV